MDCSYWNDVRNQNIVSWASVSDDNSQFSFMDIKHAQFRMKSQEVGVPGGSGMGPHRQLWLHCPWFYTHEIWSLIAFAQCKIPYLIGFVWENSAVWKLTKIFKVPWMTPVFLEVSYVVSYHISKNWIQILTFFPLTLHIE